MDFARAIIAFAAGYLLGSTSFARLVGKMVAPGQDLSDSEVEMPGGAIIPYSGVGATSVAMRAGPVPGIATGIFDAGKAYVPTLVARRRWPNEPYYAFVAAGAIAGHNWPVYHGFKGGRGQTPFYGGLAAMDWVSIPVTTAGGVLLGTAVFRDTLAAYSLGMLLTIPFAALRRRPVEVGYTAVGNVMFMIAMIPETKAYLKLRRAGEIREMGTLRDLIYSYPAMRRPDEGSTRSRIAGEGSAQR